MNYYPHHIGDFNNATRHLTRVERSLYRDLIELYYDTEQPLPGADLPALFKKVLATSEQEKDAVKALLKEFFTPDGDVWRHARCDLEIAAYRAKHAAAIRAGKASAESRLNRKVIDDERQSNARSTTVQPTSNQEPVTKNHKPRSSVSSAKASETGGKPPKSPADPVKDEIWRSGKAILEAQGGSRDEAGSFLGKLVKDHGQALVLDAVRDCARVTPANAKEWLVARCQERRGQSRQTQLERRNADVAKTWAEGGSDAKH